MHDCNVHAPPEIRFDKAADPACLDQVIELGDRNNKTLGFLPFAGFRTAAAEGRIAVALADDGEVLGYCLFDLPREVVRIVQVCISAAARHSGLARTLLDAVSARYSGRLGLVLKCRADWPADKMWPKLDFVAQTQVLGRSKAKHPLTVWWRSHGHADLFTLLDEYKAASRSAAIDSNVYCDLHSAKKRQGGKHTAVLAPLIADDELNIMLLPSLETEIYATKDHGERTRFLNAKVNYTRAKEPASPDIVDHLIAGIPNHILAKDTSLQRDAELIAEAYANGIDLFITRDRKAIQYFLEPATELAIEVLHPTEVPTYLDVQQSHHTYQPVHLEETTFTVQRLDRALTADEVALLLDNAEGERLIDLRRRLADLAGRATTDVERSALFDGDVQLRAAWADRDSAALEVLLLRIPSGTLQTTLASQLSQMLRIEAIRRGKCVVRITDPHVQRAVRAILEADGFYADTDGLAALTLPVIGTWPEVSAKAQAVAEREKADALLHLLELPENPSTAQTVEFERLWAPAKVLGQGIANYLVPIKPPFASELLGYPASLMSRPDDLGLSREHVYYSSRPGQLRPPARILWYISGRTEPSAIATSNLVEVRVDTPKRLHRLYARLGVWNLADIEKAASHGKAAAFRFTDTEMFPHMVGLDRIRALAPRGRRLLLRSAQELDDGWYERIYREGVQR
jgi:hypothetical protein